MGRVSNAKERLIATAMPLIWQRGYNAVGVNELCKQAGVKPGSFYYFFSSKQELVLTVLEENWKQTQANVLEPAFAKDVPPAHRITKIFELAYQQQCHRQEKTGRVLGCAFGSLGSELGHQDEVIRSKVEEIFARFCQYFERALQDAQDTGSLTIVDIPTRAKAILAYLEGVLLLARTQNSTDVVAQLAPTVLAVAGFEQVIQSFFQANR